MESFGNQQLFLICWHIFKLFPTTKLLASAFVRDIDDEKKTAGRELFLTPLLSMLTRGGRGLSGYLHPVRFLPKDEGLYTRCPVIMQEAQ